MARMGKLPITGRLLPSAQPFPFVGEWLAEQASYNEKTAKTYITGIRAFADWLQYTGVGIYSMNMPWPMPLEGITNDRFFLFQVFYGDFRTRSTTSTYLMGILSFLEWLKDNDHCPDGVLIGEIQRKLRRQRKKRKAQAHDSSANVAEMDAIRTAQMPQITAYYRNLDIPETNDHHNRRLTLLRDRAIIFTMFITAMRISEVASLKRQDIENGWAPVISGKGGKQRTVHIKNAAARDAIDAYLSERDDDYPALFISHARNSFGNPVTITTIHTAVKKPVKALNLHHKLSAHDYRHYRATQLLRDGVPIEVLQELLGHKDVSTTRNIYAPILGADVVDSWLDKVDSAVI